MKLLKELLNENTSVLSPWMFKTIEEIKGYLARIVTTNYVIHPDLSIDVDGSVTIGSVVGKNAKFVVKKGNQRLLPVQFHHVQGSFNCSALGLTSLVGTPRYVDRDFFCSYNKLQTLEGGPRHVKNYYCQENMLFGLHNIHRHIEEIEENLIIHSNPISSHILGVMKIEGLKRLNPLPAPKSDTHQLTVAVEIINKHLPGGNIHDVQEELIEAGLKEFARL